MQGTRVRSFDFFPGDTLYVEGVVEGFVRCPFITMGGPEGTPDLTILPFEAIVGHQCPHAAVRVDTRSPEWLARGNFEVGILVYPPLAENGWVVPLP